MASYSLHPQDLNTSWSILLPDMEKNTECLNTKQSIIQKTRIMKNQLHARLQPAQQKLSQSHLRLPKVPLFSPHDDLTPLHHMYNTLLSSILS